MRGIRVVVTVAGLIALTVVGTGCQSSTGNAQVVPTATKGNVVITLDRDSYGPSQPFGVTVTNNGKKNYYAVDSHSTCTILEVQIYLPDKKQWATLDPCLSGATPRPILLKADQAVPYTFAPLSASDPNAWAPGTYRVMLAYSANADGTTDAAVAYSRGFTVR